MSLATIHDLTDYMSGVTFSASQRSAAQIVLDGVQGELEDWLGRRLEAGTFTETVRVDPSGYVPLANTPVTTVTSVITEYAAVVTSYRITSGMLDIPDTLADQNVTVTYEGGMDASQHKNIKLAILRVAAREMTNRHDDTLTVKGLQTTNPQNDRPAAGEADIGWRPSELKKLQRHKRRTVVT